jgi:hypothetical protein
LRSASSRPFPCQLSTVTMSVCRWEGKQGIGGEFAEMMSLRVSLGAGSYG